MTVIDGWWDDDLLDKVLDEFPAHHHPGWRRYHAANEIKYEGPPELWGTATWAFFDQVSQMGDQVTEWTGIPGLHMETIGGGYHLIPPGGRLAVHTDFTRSPQTGRYRRVNLLVYLNHGWTDPGGCLELWDGDTKIEVVPEFNRMVVFATSGTSWHGHPKPALRWRRSLAAYWFTDEPGPDYPGEQSTVWGST